MGAGVRVEVLGPLRLLVDGAPVEVPGPRRRAVLALLALAGGRVLSVDELLDAVWPGEMPDSGRRALHSHVSRLRGHLGVRADALERVGAGYRLEAEVDLDEARTLPPEEAVRLWRGTALDEFADVAPLAAAAVAAGELRLDLVDAALERRLAAGRDAALVEDASRAAAEAPLRERTAVTLVRALAAAGRQADAMRAAHEFRTRLVEETGFDPSPALAAAERDAATAVPAATASAATVVAPPAPDTPLVGRDHELDDLRARLEAARLVTVVGPGGVGKTRLVSEVVAGRDDAVVVELASVDDPRRTLDAIGDALGLTAPDGDRLLDAARFVVASRPLLLVLDNCEHLLGACRDVAAALFAASATLRVLATSREPLGVAGEHVLRLGPLPEADAVDAFVAHARRRDPDFAAGDPAALADLVRRLDGLPLALELAAGRVSALGVDDLRDRLGRALDLLAGGRRDADARHRTLRSTIEWSYRLLEPEERRLLRALAVLPGGFDLATAEHVAERLDLAADPAAVVARLVDASVVTAEAGAGGRRRYRLFDAVRAFALEDLSASGERSAVEATVVAWVVSLAERIDVGSRGPDEPAANATLHAELANLRAAHDLAAARGDDEALVELSLHLDNACLFRGLPELSAWAIELAVRPDLDRHPRRGALLGAGARGAWLRGELDLAERLASDALEVADRWHGGRHRGLDVLGTVCLFRGEPARARDLYLASVDAGSPRWGAATASAALGAAYAGDVEGALALLDRAFADAEATGAPSLLGYCHYVRGEVVAPADAAAAVEDYQRAVELARQADVTFVEGVAMVGLASVWGRTGERAAALEAYGWLIHHWRRAAAWVQLWTTMRNLAVLVADARPACAALLLLAATEANGAPLVDEATAALHADVLAQVATTIGGDELARIRARASKLARADVVDEALAAVEAERSA